MKTPFLVSSLVLMSAIALSACGGKIPPGAETLASGEKAPLSAETSTSLVAYTDPKVNYETSHYSFRHLTHNSNVTGNRYELSFDSSDEFRTQMVVGDVGSIVDLGEMACADIPNRYEPKEACPGGDHGGYPHKEDRKNRPMFWIKYSDAWDKLSETRGGTAQAKVGHCYIVHHTSSDGIVVAVFHVKALDSGKSVTIDEIEVFSRAELK